MIQKAYLGVDIGGSGIKGAIVDIEKGELIGERFRVATPKPSTPKAVAKAFAELVDHFNWKNKCIGVGFPAIVKNGKAQTAANIDKSWIGINIEELLADATDCQICVRNDADVAGIAEMEFGVGKGKNGTVVIITIGTGLGSALFIRGTLLPNTEFGHLYLKGHAKIAEQYAADSIRKNNELSWTTWAERFNEYLQHIEMLLSPDLIILGGGNSKKFHKYKEVLSIETPITPAELLNNAGIIGAAVHASEMEQTMVKT